MPVVSPDAPSDVAPAIAKPTKAPTPGAGALSFTPQAILLDPAAPSPRGYAQVLTSALPISPVPAPAAWGANGSAAAGSSRDHSPLVPDLTPKPEQRLKSPRNKENSSANFKKESSVPAAQYGSGSTPNRQDMHERGHGGGGSSGKRKLREGDVVWARIAPYPFWPARVESEAIDEVSAEEYASETGKVCILLQA